MSWQVEHYVAEWPEEWGKGIDDVLKAGHTLEELTYIPAEEYDAIYRERRERLTRQGEPSQKDQREAVVEKAVGLARAARYRRNDEFFPRDRRGEKLVDRVRVYDRRDALATEQLALLEERLVEFPGGSEVRAARLADSIRHCGHQARHKCKLGGSDEQVGRHFCKHPGHASCGSRTDINIRRNVTLPDLEGDRWYRSLLYLLNVPTPEAGDDPGVWLKQVEKALGDVAQRWAGLIGKFSKRKAWQGRVLCRSIAYWPHRGHSLAELRLIVIDEGDDVDELDQAVVKEFGEENVLPDDLDVRTQLGAIAVEQAREDSSLALLGMGDPQDVDLFYAWKRATSRRHLFQSYAALYQSVRAAEKPEPLTCKCHGAPMRFCGWVVAGEKHEQKPAQAKSPPVPVGGPAHWEWRGDHWVQLS